MVSKKNQITMVNHTACSSNSVHELLSGYESTYYYIVLGCTELPAYDLKQCMHEINQMPLEIFIATSNHRYYKGIVSMIKWYRVVT